MGKKVGDDIIDKILNSDDGLDDVIKNEFKNDESYNKEALKNDDEYFYSKKLKKSDYYKRLEKEADIYLNKENSNDYEYASSTSIFYNIHKPIIKLLIVFLISIGLVKFISVGNGINIKPVQGLWLDENKIYYEIYDKKLEMNMGSDDSIIYSGDITEIKETDDGYIILSKGTMYDCDTNNELVPKKKEKVSLTIKNYTKQLEEKMIGNLGDDDFEIVRCLNTPKTSRQDKDKIENIEEGN